MITHCLQLLVTENSKIKWTTFANNLSKYEISQARTSRLTTANSEDEEDEDDEDYSESGNYLHIALNPNEVCKYISAHFMAFRDSYEPLSIYFC